MTTRLANYNSQLRYRTKNKDKLRILSKICYHKNRIKQLEKQKKELK
jgi:hypothetical protein